MGGTLWGLPYGGSIWGVAYGGGGYLMVAVALEGLLSERFGEGEEARVRGLWSLCQLLAFNPFISLAPPAATARD